MNWLQIANALATDAPHLLGAFVKFVHDIAHGEGGVGKALNVINDVEQVAVEGATAVAAASAPAAAVTK